MLNEFSYNFQKFMICNNFTKEEKKVYMCMHVCVCIYVYTHYTNKKKKMHGYVYVLCVCMCTQSLYKQEKEDVCMFLYM